MNVQLLVERFQYAHAVLSPTFADGYECLAYCCDIVDDALAIVVLKTQVCNETVADQAAGRS